MKFLLQGNYGNHSRRPAIRIWHTLNHWHFLIITRFLLILIQYKSNAAICANLKGDKAGSPLSVMPMGHISKDNQAGGRNYFIQSIHSIP